MPVSLAAEAGAEANLRVSRFAVHLAQQCVDLPADRDALQMARIAQLSPSGDAEGVSVELSWRPARRTGGWLVDNAW
jgi:hypothetical protein